MIGRGNAGSDGSGSGDGVGSGSGGGSEGSVGSGNCGFRGSGLITQAGSRTDASSVVTLRESCGENWVVEKRVENFRSILLRIISLIRFVLSLNDSIAGDALAAEGNFQPVKSAKARPGHRAQSLSSRGSHFEIRLPAHPASGLQDHRIERDTQSGQRPR